MNWFSGFVHASIVYVRGTCDGKSGTFGAIDLLQKDIEVIIGPACGHG